jgi:hypothetical protein
MSRSHANLTVKKAKKRCFDLWNFLNNRSNFAIRMVLDEKWCKNYTIDNFTFM